jgi:hypothetical protein
VTVTLRNYAFNDAGDPIVGATVQAVGRASPGTHTYSTTTDANGMWEFVARPDDVYDVSVTASSKVRRHKGDVAIQIGAFVNATGTTPIGPGTVTATELATNAVTQVKVADAAIGTAELVDLGVTTGKLAALAVTTPKIAAGAVTSSELAPGAVGTTHLQDGSVTAAKLAAGAGGGGSSIPDDNSVSTVKIVDGAVTSAKLGTGAVTSTKLATDAVGSSAISTGAVGANELAANAVWPGSIQDGAIAAAKLGIDSVGAAAIAPGVVGTSELADNAVTSAKIGAGQVIASRIGASEVGTTQLNNAAVTTAKIQDGAVTRAKLDVAMQHDQNFLLGAGSLALSTARSDVITAGTIQPGTYLFFATIQVQFTTVDETCLIRLVNGAADVAPTLTAHAHMANALETVTGLWIVTVAAAQVVKLQANEGLAGQNVSIIRNQSDLGYVQLF